jgi:hypothetical protein
MPSIYRTHSQLKQDLPWHVIQMTSLAARSQAELRQSNEHEPYSRLHTLELPDTLPIEPRTVTAPWREHATYLALCLAAQRAPSAINLSG